MVSDSSIAPDMWQSFKNLALNAISESGISASLEPAYNGEKQYKPMVVLPPVQFEKLRNQFNTLKGRYSINAVMFCYGSTTLEVDTLKQAIFNELDKDNIDGVSIVSYNDDYDFNVNNDSPLHLVTVSVSMIRE